MSVNKNNKNKEVNLGVFKRVLALARPYRKLLIGAIVLAILSAIVSTLRPYLVNYMVDKYIMNKDISGLKLMAFIFLGFVILNAVLKYLFTLSTAVLGESIVKDTRMLVYNKMINFNLNYFNNTRIGTATTRTINDIESIKSVFQQGAITIIADLLAVLAALIVMFYTSWRLTLICLLLMPLLIIATYIFKERVRVAFQKVRTKISDMNSFLQERISGMKIIQIFAVEDKTFKEFDAINQEYKQANVNTVNYYAIFFPVVELITSMALALMVWLGARAHLEGHITFGALVAFPLYLNLLFRPIRMLADKFNSVQMGLVAANRVFGVLDDKSVIPNAGTFSKENIDGKVSFQDVRFSYDGENEVLKGISFDLNPGETLALVGSTGSGKSTIINLLSRFYDPQNGSISVDDVDIKNYDLDSYRKHFSIVLQDVFLFNGTVLENISLRDERITRAEIIEAAKVIGAHDFIMKLPDNYDYKVMERGNNLSVGQRQLISFVRALVFDPDILILDEATSSIDTETETIIQYAIEKLIEKRTSIIVAHRLSTIQHADKIAVMDKGKIIEIGNHTELLKNPEGRYRELYDLQFSTV